MYDQIYSMLDENDVANLIKAYKLFVNYEDDKINEDIKTNTLVTTGQYDVGSTHKWLRIYLIKLINQNILK